MASRTESPPVNTIFTEEIPATLTYNEQEGKCSLDFSGAGSRGALNQVPCDASWSPRDQCSAYFGSHSGPDEVLVYNLGSNKGKLYRNDARFCQAEPVKGIEHVGDVEALCVSWKPDINVQQARTLTREAQDVRADTLGLYPVTEPVTENCNEKVQLILCSTSDTNDARLYDRLRGESQISAKFLFTVFEDMERDRQHELNASVTIVPYKELTRQVDDEGLHVGFRASPGVQPSSCTEHALGLCSTAVWEITSWKRSEIVRDPTQPDLGLKSFVLWTPDTRSPRRASFVKYIGWTKDGRHSVIENCERMSGDISATGTKAVWHTRKGKPIETATMDKSEDFYELKQVREGYASSIAFAGFQPRTPYPIEYAMTVFGCTDAVVTVIDKER